MRSDHAMLQLAEAAQVQRAPCASTPTSTPTSTTAAADVAAAAAAAAVAATPSALPDELRCVYPSKYCPNARAVKLNGDRHKFCEPHRRKANLNQRRWQQRRRQLRRDVDSFGGSGSDGDGDGDGGHYRPHDEEDHVHHGQQERGHPSMAGLEVLSALARPSPHVAPQPLRPQGSTLAHPYTSFPDHQHPQPHQHLHQHPLSPQFRPQPSTEQTRYTPTRQHPVHPLKLPYGDLTPRALASLPNSMLRSLPLPPKSHLPALRPAKFQNGWTPPRLPPITQKMPFHLGR